MPRLPAPISPLPPSPLQVALAIDNDVKAARIVKGRLERTVLGQVARAIKIVLKPGRGGGRESVLHGESPRDEGPGGTSLDIMLSLPSSSFSGFHTFSLHCTPPVGVGMPGKAFISIRLDMEAIDALQVWREVWKLRAPHNLKTSPPSLSSPSPP